MSWRMISKPYTTAEMIGTPTISQRFTTSTNQALRGVAAGVLVYNNPAITALTMEIWTDRDSSAAVLIATSSTSYSKVQLLGVENSSYNLVGFTFDDIALRSGGFYHLALRASGYTGDATSHVAWRKSYPDPQYRTGMTLNAAKAANHHLEFSLITAEI